MSWYTNGKIYCYICGIETEVTCYRCGRPICKGHHIVMRLKDMCPDCNKKRKINIAYGMLGVFAFFIILVSIIFSLFPILF